MQLQYNTPGGAGVFPYVVLGVSGDSSRSEIAEMLPACSPRRAAAHLAGRDDDGGHGRSVAFLKSRCTWYQVCIY